MDINMDALEATARATDNEPWHQTGDDQREIHSAFNDGADHFVARAAYPSDAAFIAAASPAVMLELVRRLKAAEEKDAMRPMIIDLNKSEDIMLEQIRAAESLTGQKSTYHHVVMRAFRETIRAITADVKAVKT